MDEELLADLSGTFDNLRVENSDLRLSGQQSSDFYRIAEELKAILDATADAVVTINRQGTIVRLNAATEKLFGYAISELTGQNVSNLIPLPKDEKQDPTPHPFQHTEGARVFGIGREVYCRRKDGTTFPAELSVSEVDHLGLFTGVIRDISDRRRLQNEILRAVSEEQKRIGQDLHDSAGQELTGLRYLIQNHIETIEKTLDPDLPADSIRSLLSAELSRMYLARDSIGGLQRIIRNIIRGLAPLDIDGHDLMSALTDLTSNISELHHLRCSFRCESPVIFHDNLTARHLFRIAQEAVNNAVRHSGASTICVSLDSDRVSCTLSVQDNGCGINQRNPQDNRGFGLHIMSYRASLIGAHLSVDHVDAGGTVVRCRLPHSENFGE
jgi:PAS domain S-box-containing protein